MITSNEEKKAVKKLLPLMLMLLMLCALASKVHSQEAQSTQSFASFWAQFKAAVAKNDKEAVATMTQFPVDISERVTRDAFMKKYDEIFNHDVRRCFTKEKPLKDDQPPSRQGRVSYSMFCGHDIFSFELVEGKYKLTSIGFND
jgi:hypothetical protein